MEQLKALWHLVNEIPPETWSVIVATIVSAFAVSGVGIFVKKLINIDNERRREKVLQTLIILKSFLAAAVSYLITVPRFTPWVIGVQGAFTFLLTQPLYTYFLKPLAIKMWASLAAHIEAATAENEAKAAAVPVGGLPISATPSAPEDFTS